MNTLKQSLQSKNLLNESDIKIQNTDESSWFIFIIHAIGGTLSAFLLLILLAFTFSPLFDSEIALIVLGSLSALLSYFVLRKDNSHFIHYFALIFLFVGEILFSIGLNELLNFNENMVVLSTMLIFTGLFFLIPSALHRFLSVLIVLAAGFHFAYMFNILVLYVSTLLLLTTYIWLNEYSSIKYLHHKRIFGYGVVIFLLFFTQAESISLIQRYSFNILPDIYPTAIIPDFIYPILYYVIGLLSVGMILKKFNLAMRDKTFIALLFGTFVLYYAQPFGLDIATTMIVLLLAYYGSNKLLFALGILGALFNIQAFYMLMYINFIDKAKYLAIFGVTLLVLSLILHISLKKGEK